MGRSSTSCALAPLDPYLRGAPPGLPFRFDATTIQRGLNFTLVTAAGDLDVLGEAAGGGTYDAHVRRSPNRPFRAQKSSSSVQLGSLSRSRLSRGYRIVIPKHISSVELSPCRTVSGPSGFAG
jgi:hypothetical protein